MLRTLFVLTLVGIGVYYALQAPFYGLLLYIGNAYFRPEDWAWGDFIRNLKLSLIVGWFVLLASVFTRQQFVINGRIVLILLFTLHTLFSTLLSEYPDYSWHYWKDFLKSTTITYLIIVLVTDLSKLRLLLFVMVMAVGVLGAKQGWLYLIAPPAWGENPNKIVSLGDNNGVAVGMLMLTPIVAFLAQTTQRPWSRWLYRVLLLGVLGRAITTYSRGAFLACVALGGVYWLRSRKKFHVLLGIAVILITVLPALPAEYWDRMQTIQTFFEEREGSDSMQGRLHFWNVAVVMANAHPFFGIGYMSYPQAYDSYDFLRGAYGQRRAVHSAYFKVLAELGYVGLVLFAVILLSAFHCCHRVHKLAKRDPSLSDLEKAARALEVSLVAFLVGGAFLSYAYKEIVWHSIGLAITVEKLATQRAKEKLATGLSNGHVTAPDTPAHTVS